MKQLFFFLLFVVSTVVPQAFANKIIGNGGMVVVCAADSGEPAVRLLDVYETEDIYNAPFLPELKLSEPEGADYKEKFLKLVARISNRFPDLSRQILEEYANFEAHSAFKKNKKLPDTADDFHSDLPIGCELKQLVVQKDPMFVRRPWYTIAVEYWDQMDDFNKAATILHETLLRLGVQNGVEHSVGVRYLVGLLLADDLQNIGDQDWIEAFTQSRVRNFEIGTLKIPLFSGDFVTCKPLPGTVMCARSENLRVATLRYNTDRRIQQVTYDTSSGEPIQFKSYGNITGTLQAREVRFDWSRKTLELSTSGDLTLYSPENQIMTRFNGRILPEWGTVSGTQVMVLSKRLTHNAVLDYEGSLAGLLTKFGVLNSDYIAFGNGSQLPSQPVSGGFQQIGDGQKMIDQQSKMVDYWSTNYSSMIESHGN